MKPRQLGASGYVLEHAMKEVFTLTHNGMKQIPTAREFYDAHYSDDAVVMMRDFAKMHVEAMIKDMEQKLLDTLDDMNYLEENVCGVIEEIREYKPDNIK